MTARVSPERMAELQALADAATKEAWVATWEDGDQWWSITGTGQPLGDGGLWTVRPEVATSDARDSADVEFIAASRQAVPDLIEDLTDARAQRDTAIGEHIAAVQEIQRLRTLMHAIGGDDVTHDIVAQRDAAVATIQRVEALHSRPIKVSYGWTCPTCFGHGWPCSTARALAGDDRV